MNKWFFVKDHIPVGKENGRFVFLSKNFVDDSSVVSWSKISYGFSEQFGQPAWVIQALKRQSGLIVTTAYFMSMETVDLPSEVTMWKYLEDSFQTQKGPNEMPYPMAESVEVAYSQPWKAIGGTDCQSWCGKQGRCAKCGSGGYCCSSADGANCNLAQKSSADATLFTQGAVDAAVCVRQNRICSSVSN